MKTPFTFTKEDYLAEINETNFSDADLEKMIDRACNFIFKYVRFSSTVPIANMFKTGRVTEDQKSALIEASIEQLTYIELNGGELQYMSGFNEVTGTIIPNSQLFEKYLAPTARMILAEAGLLYRGIR